MLLEQYIHKQSLYHINDNNCNIQLAELDNTGKILNIYYYAESNISYSLRRDISIIPKPLVIHQYRYAIKTKYGLYMFLFLYDIAIYDFVYKLYDLEHNNFAWLDLTYNSLFNDIQGEKIYVHNRLLNYMKQTDRHPALVEQNLQNYFHDMKFILNQSLQYYIDDNIINCEESKYELIYHNNIYKIVNNRQYKICQFTDETIKNNEYIKWQLIYSLLAHRISTEDYYYLLNNIQNIYQNFKEKSYE